MDALDAIRWHLRTAIRELVLVMPSLDLELHQDRRFTGHTENGFDFLECWTHTSRKPRPS